MKLHLTLFALLIISLSALSQKDYGVKINGGLSRISNTFGDNIDDYHIQLPLSGQAGFFYNYHIGGKSVIGAELLFNQTEGKEYVDVDFTDETGKYLETGKFYTYSHISYLTLPVYYGVKFNKLSVNLGFQGSFYLFSSSIRKTEGSLNGESIDAKSEPNEMIIDTYNIGPRIGVVYNLDAKISLEANYYYGLNNIYSKGSYYERKVQQMLIGIRYSFI